MTKTVDELSDYVDTVFTILANEGPDGIKQYIDDIVWDDLHIEEVCAFLRVAYGWRAYIDKWVEVRDYACKRAIEEGYEVSDILYGLLGD